MSTADAQRKMGVPALSHKLPPLIPRRRQPSAQTEAAPSTPPLRSPRVTNTIKFQIPSKRILSTKDHELFLSSPTYELILAFIFGLSDSVRGVSVSSVSRRDFSPPVEIVLSILDDAEDLLKYNPPLETGSRFGNPAFRAYIADITAHSPEWHQRLSFASEALGEVSCYLENAFGSPSRIDYGSGHELNFLLWVLCLNRLSLLSESNFPALALVVFPRYLKLMRSVQSTYYLEPAGSHGVWGLDDYQFLPFLFGAAQLLGHPFITPKAIHNQLTLEEYGKDYLYLDQVSFVNSVKNVDGLRWHSPMLDDISSAKSWEKVEAGMKKMFVKEVLGKLPVMQHFLFGALIPAPAGMSVETEAHADDENCDHDHNAANTWDDCCGIKVPSSLGAAQEMKKRMGGGQGLRRLPFD